MGEENKKMSAFTADNIRAIVKAVNENNIKKEDIVSIIHESGQFFLIYYK